MFQVTDKSEIKKKQQVLKDRGFYTGKVDGIWGPLSEAAMVAARGEKVVYAPFDTTRIIWAKKVSREFIIKIRNIAKNLGMPTEGANWLMACIAWESGETFSPSEMNKAGSGATGLIQFMPATAIGYFYSAAEQKRMTPEQKKAAGIEACKRLAAMTAEQQLDYVELYFQPYKGRLKNLGDVYMAILWPAGIGKDDSFVLWDEKSRPTTFRQNAGLDVNKDKVITRAECLIKVNQKAERGLQFIL